MISRLSLMLAFCFALVVAVPLSADAKKYKKRYKNSGYQHITVYSRFDANSKVTVPIRRARDGGIEYRLPGHKHWLHCHGNCTWSIQKTHLDVLEYIKQPFGPGYIQFNFGY